MTAETEAEKLRNEINILIEMDYVEEGEAAVNDKIVCIMMKTKFDIHILSEK